MELSSAVALLEPHCYRYTITLLHKNRLNKTESAIFVSLMCFLPREDLHSEVILSSLQLVLYREAAVKHLPIHHHSEGYIFLSPGISGLILSQFENRVPLNPVLGVGSVAPLHYCS